MRKKSGIVIADDNINIRETLKDMLAEKKYPVDAVKNGYELLVYLKENSPRIIILDLMMPEKDGLEIISAVKGISPYSKIIIYTGFQKYEHSVYVGIADKFLLKSEGPERLLEAIEELA